MHCTPHQITTLMMCFAVTLVGQEIPSSGLILDLDASKGVVCEDGDKVVAWRNQMVNSLAKEFVKREQGREKLGSGRPTLQQNKTALNGHPSLVFHQQELICLDEDVFDTLTNGKGHTWVAVLAVHQQRSGIKDVNSFFGNLRNGDKYEGLWGCLNDDNTLWWGARNGLTFGRFDVNNPKLVGPKLESNKFYLVAGRMGAGLGTVKLELFVDRAEAAVSIDFPVNPKSNPSRMAIGQERDAIEHPGLESFDGEIARFLIWEQALDDAALQTALDSLRKKYF